MEEMVMVGHFWFLLSGRMTAEEMSLQKRKNARMRFWHCHARCDHRAAEQGQSKSSNIRQADSCVQAQVISRLPQTSMTLAAGTMFRFLGMAAF